MSIKQELEQLRSLRMELEEEARSLQEKQRELENTLRALEEKVTLEELKREKAIIEELKNRNKTLKEIIDQMETKKKELEAKLQEKQPEVMVALASEEEADTTPAESMDAITLTVVESSALDESPKTQEKKKRRFF
ncbi:MAG: hypothetical protein N3E52_05625 [Candidatus Bathyarchaeota archaeon]|nr:hypothetical protein [Candidatus Bathyarchaeota archaeon]